MSLALSQLHTKYGTGAKASDYKYVDYPLGYGNNPVQIAWDAIVENHFIPFPVDFYTNKTVRLRREPRTLYVPRECLVYRRSSTSTETSAAGHASA